MKQITFNFTNIPSGITSHDISQAIKVHRELLEGVLHPQTANFDVLGWVDLDTCVPEELIKRIEAKAAEIRQEAEVFLLIGVGGSNQGARTVIKAFQTGGKPEILYTGNNLSPYYMNQILAQIKGKSVYANVIAKNFATLEPGICFRMIRKYMEATYGAAEAARRIIATGSPQGSSLESLAADKGYSFLPFPLDIGGRFSVLSAVGLLPVAVAGIDIREILRGAQDMASYVRSSPPEENNAVQYGIIRNLLLERGFGIEILGFFEPRLEFFAKWWVQLFGESEGKDGTGIFPAACSHSEDLHALGQYIQDGRKMIAETFINLEDQGASLLIPEDRGTADDFDYLDGKDFAFLNRTAFEATVKAHAAGGVPVTVVNVPELTPYYMGQLFYFFEYACFISASVLGVNPFDQPGVEAYKGHMFGALGKKDRDE
jgi:glucose-6-phosphate isomerase